MLTVHFLSSKSLLFLLATTRSGVLALPGESVCSLERQKTKEAEKEFGLMGEGGAKMTLQSRGEGWEHETRWRAVSESS